MVAILENLLPDAVVSATQFVIGRRLTAKELISLVSNGIEVSDPKTEYVGMMLEAEYTYYFQAVRSCV